MLPVFRSRLSVVSFCLMLGGILCLPLVTLWIGHPSREQAYAGMPNEAGPIGAHLQEIFADSDEADVLFLGSSLVRAGIDKPIVERALSAHLGRPAHVKILALNWQGLDLQYFLLRDYLNIHHVRLVVWNLPVPGSRHVEPHVEAFHWIRFGEYSDALSGLPMQYRLSLYGDMVLGAPRELLSRIRPNLLSEKEMTTQITSESAGYYGTPFVPEPTDPASMPTLEQSYEEPPYRLVGSVGPSLNRYELHFATRILNLAREKHCSIALLHIPIDSEQYLTYMPERDNWVDTFHVRIPMIGVPSSVLFDNMDQSSFHNYYRDQHFNANGSVLFTRSILPAILRAYDEGDEHD